MGPLLWAGKQQHGNDNNECLSVSLVNQLKALTFKIQVC